MNVDIQNIDKHKSLLLIGIGDTNKYLHEIVQPEYAAEVREKFGDCDLADSYELLLKDNEGNIGNIFLMNIEVMTDYLDIARFLADYDFAYIVPIDVGVSNFFYNPNNGGNKTYYIQYMAETMPDESKAVFLITDTHADLYQDVDQFLNDMNSRERSYRAAMRSPNTKAHIVFVGNNLKGVAYANVELGRIILMSEANEYPQENQQLTAVFSIDATDNVGSMAYFKTHADGTTTIENLLNFFDEESPLKIFFIYRICLQIAKELDFSDFIGSRYVSYKKQQIENIVTQYLESVKNVLIIDYQVTDVFAKENEQHPGTVDIYLKYAIQPIGCAEVFISQTVKA